MRLHTRFERMVSFWVSFRLRIFCSSLFFCHCSPSTLVAYGVSIESIKQWQINKQQSAHVSKRRRRRGEAEGQKKESNRIVKWAWSGLWNLNKNIAILLLFSNFSGSVKLSSDWVHFSNWSFKSFLLSNVCRFFIVSYTLSHRLLHSSIRRIQSQQAFLLWTANLHA